MDKVDIKETLLIEHVELLYDFVYYRRCDMEKVFYDEDIDDLVAEIWNVEITTAVDGLVWLLNAIRYQTFIVAGEGIGRRNATFDAIVHFIQLAQIMQRLEFGGDGLYLPSRDLRREMNDAGTTAAMFTNQEIDFIASTSGQYIANQMKDGMLDTVRSPELIHWAKFSRVPDYLNPKMGAEVGTKLKFVTLPSLQSWLAKRADFLPTQFIYQDKIPEYTHPEFFKNSYAKWLKKFRIKDQDLIRALGLNPTHLKWLHKGTRGMFFRQALLLDNLIFEKATGISHRMCFPTYHEFLPNLER